MTAICPQREDFRLSLASSQEAKITTGTHGHAKIAQAFMTSLTMKIWILELMEHIQR